MQVSINQLPKSQISLKVEAGVEEMRQYLEKAAQKISQSRKIPGFRPGKATVGAVVASIGQEALWLEAADFALPGFLSQAIRESKLEILGEPEYQLENLKPHEPLIFNAILNLLPEVKLGDFKSKKIKRTKIEVAEADLVKAVENLRQSKRSEALVSREARSGDKLEINLELDYAGKQLEKLEKLPVVLGEKQFIPGFEDALVGLGQGSAKEFDLDFPRDYPQEDLAGKKAYFKAQVLGVYELTAPPLSDELAKSLGNFQNLAELTEHVRKNLEREAERLQEQRLENELIGALAASAVYPDLPEYLVNKETQKLMQELNQNLARQGILLEDYLQRVNKKSDDLLLELAPRAAERVKTSLVLRQLVKDEKITVDKEMFDQELTKLKEVYQDSDEMVKQIDAAAHREYLASQMLYRQVIEFLRNSMVAD